MVGYEKRQQFINDQQPMICLYTSSLQRVAVEFYANLSLPHPECNGVIHLTRRL